MLNHRLSVSGRLALGLVVFGGCHAIDATADLSMRPTTSGGGYELVKAPTTPKEASDAVAYCQYLRDQARRAARTNERLSLALGSIGLITTATGAAVAANTSGATNIGVASGVAALGTVLTGFAVYLMTLASTERTGEGLLSAGVVQMQNVDPYFIASLTAPTTTTNTTRTENCSIAANQTTPGKPAGCPSAPASANQPPATTDGGTTIVVTKTVQNLTVNAVDPPAVEHVRWQTCAKIIATWKAGRGAADAAMAGVFGSTSSGGSGSGSGN